MRSVAAMREALADDDLLGGVLVGSSWEAWRVVLIAAMGEALMPEERAVFQRLSGRPQEPGRCVDELWAIVGRRGGKTRAAAALAVYLAALCEHSGMAPGERPLVLFLAANQKQAGVAFNYAAGIFDAVPLLRRLVTNRTTDTIALSTGVDLEVRSANFRGLRGVTCVAVIADEAAFWYSDESSTNTDTEILTAVRPSLATTGGPLIVISSPHAQTGEVYATHRTHYGEKGDPRILVVQGASRDFNPSLPQSVVDRALERDAAAASAEYLGQFRSDLQIFVAREVVEAAIDLGVHERPPIEGIKYVAFTDPSGGSSDSMTLAVGHLENKVVTIDAIREARPPFSPDAVVHEHAELLKRYRISTVTGDRFGGEWPREKYREYGISYRVARKNRSELYLATLPQLNSKCVALLDHKRLVAQLCGLERRTARGGRDIVDHGPGQHDDVANAVAGAIVTALENYEQPMIFGMPVIVLGKMWAPPRRYRQSLIGRRLGT